MATPVSNNTDTSADHNRMIRLGTIREWDRLLHEAAKPDGRGTIAIELPYKGGRLGEPKITHVQIGCEL